MRRSIFSLLLLLPLCGAGHAVPAADSLPLHPPAPAIAPATTAFSPAGRTEELPQLAGDTLPAVRTHRIERLPLDRRRHTCRDGWRRMIPTHVKVQYAGGMGFLSFGAGWDYGRKCQWETDLYLGFLPRSKADKFYVTTTAKQSYIPWSIACGNRFADLRLYSNNYVFVCVIDDVANRESAGSIGNYVELILVSPDSNDTGSAGVYVYIIFGGET